MGRKKAGGTVPPVTLPIAKWAEAERKDNERRRTLLIAAFDADPERVYSDALTSINGGMKVSKSGKCSVCSGYTASTMTPLCSKCVYNTFKYAGAKLFRKDNPT